MKPIKGAPIYADHTITPHDGDDMLDLAKFIKIIGIGMTICLQVIYKHILCKKWKFKHRHE